MGAGSKSPSKRDRQAIWSDRFGGQAGRHRAWREIPASHVTADGQPVGFGLGRRYDNNVSYGWLPTQWRDDPSINVERQKA